MILTWARAHMCFREEGSHFLHTSFRGIIIIIRLFLPLITSSEKLADVKPELPMGLHTSHSSRYPKMIQIISNFSVDRVSPSEKGWGADVQNRETERLR